MTFTPIQFIIILLLFGVASLTGYFRNGCGIVLTVFEIGFVYLFVPKWVFDANTFMVILGLIGGIGSGKSTVAEMFCQLGAERIDADQIGHEVLQYPDVQTAARNRWGDRIFDANGQLNRKALAQIVFDPSETGCEELRFLNFLVHPHITRKIEDQIRRFSESQCRYLILDAPLLLEHHWEQRVDYLVFVDAPRSIRLARTQKRGWTQTELDAREHSQLDIEKKRRSADWIINNSGNPDETLDHVKKIWQNLDSQFRKLI
ncbi:MAG: dephospho-CoA kinase [Planctomycetaceae bacterium]|nr:dephospho-CoA kinase [Planctomycetaceae bacterium]